MRTTPFLVSLAAVGVTTLSASAQRPSPHVPAVVVDHSCYGRVPMEERAPSFGVRSRAGAGHAAASGGIVPGPSMAPPTRRAAKKAEAAPAPDANALGQLQALGYLEAADAEEGDGVAFAPQDRRQDAPAAEPIAPPLPGPRVDWGGTVHLSNDDTMSLASAQRLLYALERNVGFSLDQIRPHELLNYFSFDTQSPRQGDTFGLHTSFEQTGHDSASLAMAIEAAAPKRSDLGLTVLVDRSGSMRSDGRMDYTKRALRKMADNLQPGDQVDLVVFDHQVCTPLKNFVVGRDDPSLLRHAIEGMQPRGSTNLDLGLKSAYALATERAHRHPGAERVMVFTDAILNTGDVNPHTVTEVGKALDAHNIRLTGVGVGRDFRDDVLNKLTEKGKGAYVFLGSERVVDRLFGQGFDALVHTVAEDVRYTLTLPPSLGMKKFYGEEISTVAADIQPVNAQSGTSQVFFQDLSVKSGHLRAQDSFTLAMSWTDPVNGRRIGTSHSFTVAEASRAPTHNVHKARALMAWTDVLTAKAMGQDACGAAFHDYRSTLPNLRGDAEIAYVTELVGKWCDLSEPVAAWTAPAHTRIKLDTDVAISEVALSCPTGTQRQAVGANDSVATFQTTPGDCHVTLYGAVPMTALVSVPSTGTDVRCVARGGRLQCL